MDTLTRKRLEERILAEVQILLTEGDRIYFQGLSQSDFLEALENELRFLGLYAHNDRETPVVLRTILEQHLDQWLVDITEQKSTMSTEQQPMQKIYVEIPVSPLIQIINSLSCGIQSTKATFYNIDSMPLPAFPRISVNSVSLHSERP